jgi:COP9 signalosome complex subunit 6
MPYSSSHAVLGALLGTQTGREVEIVNTFELATDGGALDHGYLLSRKDQCAFSSTVEASRP